MKKFILSTLILVFMFSNSVFATDIENNNDKGKYCNLNFTVGYLGNKELGNIAVYFEDVNDKENKYQFLLESKKGFNATDTFKILANKTYNVTVKLGNENIAITNDDGSEIKTYSATNSGLSLTWIIKDIVEEPTQATEPVEENKEKISKEELIKDLIKETEFIKDDKRFKNFIDFASSETFKQEYLKQPNTKLEDWESMSKYEQAVMTLTELRPRGFIQSKNRELFAKNEEVFIEKVYHKDLFINCDKVDGEKVYQSFLKVWSWHWDNFENNTEYINLYDNNIFKVDDYKDAPKTTLAEEKNNKNNTSVDKEKEQSTTKENNIIDEDLDAKDRRKELASTNNYLSIIKNNIISIIILIIVGVALFVIYSKKKSNQDSE